MTKTPTPPMDIGEENDMENRQRLGHGVTVLKTLDDRECPFDL